ncbi:Rho guanine nucleotide exchange factor 12 [Geodia barretti]|uniref:Rho guanine nucleotide exchange factor 12 n=1 Tax=Geodia barretti TaxID=519541 RepID=A0AA35SFK9_GEOBA|nr:Rho guanine nucleotide exchange factor 12 [Geodia barretti]
MDASAKSTLERTVVLKQDRDGGYGFSLSKEGPVVTRVAAGSSAERAGVNAGDRLVKVNGQDVGSMKVPKVEEMVQQCSHITLTLQGKLAQNGTRAVKDSGVEISAPRQMQELTLQTMRNMLQKQRKTYETLSVNYCKAPSEKLEREIQDCESIIKLLESEIATKSPPIDAHIRTTAASVQALSSRHPVTKMADDMDLLTSRKAPTTSATHGKAFVKGGSVKHPSRAATFHNGSISPSKRRHYMLGFLGGGSSGHIVDSSDQSDDDDLSDAVDGASEAGPFGSLQELRNNPAHMSVFIHYLNTNKNPNALLFYLVSLSYQNHCKTADLRQRGMDIFWTFFTDEAPLPVDVDSAIMSRAQHTLEVEENENHLRSALVEARESLSEVIIADLADYRHKRVMGLAGMFGDHMLTNNMSISRQTEVVMNLLIPQIKTKNDDTHCASIMEASKSHAAAACLATIVLDSIGKSGIAKATSSSPLDKTQTFTRGDILLRKGRGGKKKNTIQKHGHNLHLETYTRPAFCDLCSKQLWGIIYQGYQCSECKMNIHRYYCLGQLEHPCLGKNPGFMSTSRKRRIPQHSTKKIHLSAILTGQPPPLEDTDIDLARIDSEGGRKSPLLEPASLDSREGELLREMDGGDDRHLPTTKPRSTSDPKHMLLIQSASVMPGEQPEHHHPKRESLKVSRTQSAKYDNREDHMASKQISDPHNMTMSSSDDSLIGTKLESIVEGGGAVFDEEIKELLDHDIEEELLPWALSVKREIVQSLQPYEVQRQEYIRELVYTERTHVHKLKTMQYVYKVPMTRECVLPAEQVDQLFSSLEELIQFHDGLCAELVEYTANTTNGVVKTIADVLLPRFDGDAGKKLCQSCSLSATNQVNADTLIKDWRRKNEKFKTFIKNAELHPVCRRHRLTLKELMPITWQRLTKYQLLVKNILSSYKKHWEELSDNDKEEAQKIETTLTCIKGILQYVNKQLNLAQSRRRLLEYQSKLDTSALERSSHPIAQQFKALDLTIERRMLLHEGPLTWKIQGRKVIELYALLLTDILVLLERHEERDKFYLRCYTVEGLGGVKEELSPVIRLKDCLLRSAAADKGGRTFLMVNNSSLMKLAQMYEFTTDSPREKRQLVLTVFLCGVRAQ